MRATLSLLDNPQQQSAKDRIAVYNAQHQELIPGDLLWHDNEAVGRDSAALGAFNGVRKTCEFYRKVFGRDSVDGQGISLDSTVHYGTNFTNAMWTGKQMIYGDGDGKIYNGFTSDLDVIAHELTHGVVQYTCGLIYQGEAGALNEHLADAFGSMVKQYDTDQTVDQASWLIGETIFKAPNSAVRSLKAPGTAFDILVSTSPEQHAKDAQPADMSAFYAGADDAGGVHTNSGIPNHAFYLAANSLGGKSWESIGKVWYKVMAESDIPARATFVEFAQKTIDGAAQILGALAAATVQSAWEHVRVLPGPPLIAKP